MTLKEKEDIDYIIRLNGLEKEDTKVVFGGRLGEYKYYDMDKTIEDALNTARTELDN